MKHPATAAGVLVLHLLVLGALAAWPAAQAPAAATEHRTARPAPAPGVLLVALHSPAAPALPPALAPHSPSKQPPDKPTPKPTADTAAMPAAAHAPAAGPGPVAVTLAPADAVAAAAPAALGLPTPMASAAPAPPTPPVAPAAPAPEPVLTLARAERHGCPPAPHPAVLRERGIEGEVLLLVRVGSDGRAAEVRLQQTSGWRLLDHAALAQAQACRFVPARRGVQAVESWVDFPVRFSLQG